METRLPPLRSHLYAPGNNDKLLAKVFDAGADAVILDLEDAVPPAEKDHARVLTAETVARRAGADGPPTFVRINHPTSGWAEQDVAAVVRRGLVGIRIPKVEDAETVRQVAAWVERAEAAAGLALGSVVLICIIESAAGVFRAYEIASAQARVIALAFGATDYMRDINAVATPEGLELLHARSELVLASRVAGIQPPIDTVYTRLDDSTGLEVTARHARSLGFFGKSAIHPKQVSIIHAVFTPSAQEVARAREVVDAAREAAAGGTGAFQRGQGEFIDAAVVRRAQDVIDLAARLGNV